VHISWNICRAPWLAGNEERLWAEDVAWTVSDRTQRTTDASTSRHALPAPGCQDSPMRGGMCVISILKRPLREGVREARATSSSVHFRNWFSQDIRNYAQRDASSGFLLSQYLHCWN
jgi:hypothetical protein